jgi:hypothetical protein
MKPGDLVFMQLDGSVNFKAGDAGLIIAKSPDPGLVLPDADNMFDVLIGGEIEYLFDYEMVLASDHLQLVNDGAGGYDRENENP